MSGITMIVAILAFMFVIALCCGSDSKSSSSQYKPNMKPNTTVRRNRSYAYYDYDECPSCGAPGYDGYCEECGYPDINQGWIGENY